MRRQEKDGIIFYVFESLDGLATHAIFTRHGGVSPDPWRSLNVGKTVGDEAGRVDVNRLRAFSSLGRDQDSRYDVWQVHGVNVAAADVPRPHQPPLPRVDAVITDQPAVTLFMRFADCVPILLVDPVRKAVGLVHAGWMGTVEGILLHAVKAMEARYGSRPANMLAAIGPSIGPDHYQIGPQVSEKVRQAFGEESPAVLAVRSGSMHFDLWQANRLLLERVGIRKVEVAGICTACEVEDFYSHRAEKGRTGRFGALIALPA